jgi:hypothetical protein
MLNDGRSRTDCLDAALAPLDRLGAQSGSSASASTSNGSSSDFAAGSVAMRLAVAANLFALPSGEKQHNG